MKLSFHPYDSISKLIVSDISIKSYNILPSIWPRIEERKLTFILDANLLCFNSRNVI
jgi:hypothetical protein